MQRVPPPGSIPARGDVGRCWVLLEAGARRSGARPGACLPGAWARPEPWGVPVLPPGSVPVPEAPVTDSGYVAQPRLGAGGEGGEGAGPSLLPAPGLWEDKCCGWSWAASGHGTERDPLGGALRSSLFFQLRVSTQREALPGEGFAVWFLACSPA